MTECLSGILIWWKVSIKKREEFWGYSVLEKYKASVAAVSSDSRSSGIVGIPEYREGKMTAKINTSPVNVHQYFRKCLSEIVDCEEWDWRTGINNELWIPKLIDECKKKLVF